MKTIPDKFGANGMKYELLKRSDEAAVYKTFTSDDAFIGWEVHCVRRREPETFTRAGKTYTSPAFEQLASNEDFGRYAWYFDRNFPEQMEERFNRYRNWRSEGGLGAIRKKVSIPVKKNIQKT